MNPIVRKAADEELGNCDRIHIIEPLDVVDCHNFEARCYLCLTDSGGIQEETTFLGVPCLTYRDNTERPVTIRYGTNQLVNRFDIHDAVEWVLGCEPRPPTRIPLWDGRTAYRIADALRQWWSAAA